MDWDLGREKARRWEQESKHWNNVDSPLRQIVVAGRRRYAELLSTGNRVHGDYFLAGLRDAFGDCGLQESIQLWMEVDFTFAAASMEQQSSERGVRKAGWMV